MKITKKDTRLYPSSKAVITQFLQLPGKDRVENIIKRVLSLSSSEVESCLGKIKNDFAGRHRDLDEILIANFKKIEEISGNNQMINFPENKKMLLGAFFTKEYSIESAALFNPSIVAHWDQSNLEKGAQRFIMSLRATGEGHISSIVFQTGVVDKSNNILLDKSTGFYNSLKKNEQPLFEKSFIEKRVLYFPGFKKELLDILPDRFAAAEALRIIDTSDLSKDNLFFESIQNLQTILDTNYELQSSSHIPIDEKVIFPNAKGESMGMEDARFVKFIDGQNVTYYATYTAYNGHHIKTQLIETKDFNKFKIRTLYGVAISDKGMALFPEKINGKYVMISRQGGEKIGIMFSDDLYFWNSYQTLMEPLFPWELVQMGNCGSPVKTEKGWLLLIHGVGVMRTYVISAILLDLKDPSVILGRLNKPILEADEEEREGYVPNVVYTCGLLLHKDVLIIPYAVSDSATGFATVELKDILDELIQNN